MADSLHDRILQHLQSSRYRPQKARSIARELDVHHEEDYPQFRDALRDLLDVGRLAIGPKHTIVLPPAPDKKKPSDRPIPAPVSADAASADAASPPPADDPAKQKLPRDVVVGPYRQNKRGFGFVMPTNPPGHDDLYIAEEDNHGAITGDIVKAKITGRYRKGAEMMFEGKIFDIVQRTKTHFVGTLDKQHNQWVVLPDGNDFTDPISTPDAASKHIKPGTKVAVELTQYPSGDTKAAGVITEVLGQQGEKDVDLRSVIIQYNLPAEFPEDCKQQARDALDRFNRTLDQERARRLDLTGETIITIDPDDAKDYDDAISIRKLENGNWQLGVHIADVAFFVEPGSPLDVEAVKRGNSTYFPGHVIPMLPEVLSNGVCSLQEGVPRLCKSAFIELDEDARPVGTKFADSIISSKKRLRYREAQAILDGKQVIPHPDGDRTLKDYDEDVLALLHDMDDLAKRLQKRRHDAGQLVLGLPEVDLVLDEDGKVMGAVPEDESYTHTVIEMFMVEANEAVARLLDSMNVPFIRRTHPEPEPDTQDRLRLFTSVAGYKLPKQIDRKALQSLLETVKGQPDAFAVNLAVLKSLTRAVYSPEQVGHYALASEQYCHFTSPIRRYADLTVHRLLGKYLQSRETDGRNRKAMQRAVQDGSPNYQELVDLGKRISMTERRSDDAEGELRTIKLLELLEDRIGDVFHGVVTNITKFGIFIQLQEYLIDGLIRYQDMGDDYWEADERAGVVRGRKSGQRIKVGDLATVAVVRVDVPRRELDVAIQELRGKPTAPHKIGTVASKHAAAKAGKGKPAAAKRGVGTAGRGRKPGRTGSTVPSQRSKPADRRKR